MPVHNTSNTSLVRGETGSPTSTVQSPALDTTRGSILDTTLETSTVRVDPRSPVTRVQPMIRNPRSTPKVNNNNNNNKPVNANSTANGTANTIDHLPPSPPANTDGTSIHICHWHGDCYVNVSPSGIGALMGLPTTAQFGQQNQQQHRN